ncbi:hypothetical protein PAXRUDRAFT_832569 [Paxillus rubicundulus Ve08.2h10]|uniref:Uncharacterized protein n=1 Tax=Paxillus rubicundulus Ve08.2h10 TaxID=930991 RepID=A0A0D0DJQ7_9AGAM|nr:hypothetical protein PAXRUDRAFT_832569 [Paxillus rubicundulus Ve08.2h10]
MTAIRRRAAVGPRAWNDSTISDESLMQHVYFVVALAFALLLVAARISVLRRRNRPLSDFFKIGSSSAYANDPDPVNPRSRGSSYRPGYGIPLAPVPTAYLPDRRVRAADTDAGGRRLGPAGEDWDGKDDLPAYDGVGGPPKYVEADWCNAGPQGGAQHSWEQPVNVPPPSGAEDDRSGIRR